MASKKQRRAPVREQLEFDELSVNLAASSVEEARKRQSWYRRSIIAGLVIGSLVTTGLIVQFVAAAAFPAEPPAQMRLDSPGRAAATVSVEQWLEQSPAPLPGGQLIAWEGMTEERVESDDSNTPAYTVEVHTFSLASGLSLFDATVPVWVSELGQAKVTAQPQLTPRLASAPSASSDLWPGWKSSQAQPQVTEAVASWAESFTSGDPARLKLATGDQDTTRVYLPLPLAAEVTSAVDFAGLMPGEDAETAPLMLVRASLQIVWPGQESDGSVTYQTMSYDLLVANPASGAPTIVSWGGAGTGPTLAPFSVGVTGYDPTDGSEDIEDDASTETPERSEPAETQDAPEPAPSTETEQPQTDGESAPEDEDVFGDVPLPTHDAGGEG